jgi:hypothetical protein
MSKLIDELKKRFASPRHALRALGLDESLLDQEPDQRVRRRRARLAYDESQGEGERAEERLHDRPLERGNDDIEPMRERGMPPQNMGTAEDDEEDAERFEAFRDHLRQHSRMSEDEIEEACNMARDYVHRSRRGRMNGKDRMPRNRLKGGRSGRDEVREGQRLMHRIEDANSISSGPDPNGRPDDPMTLTDHGLDNRRTPAMDSGRARLAQMYPGIERIGDCNGDLLDTSTDKSVEKMFPNIRRIGFA